MRAVFTSPRRRRRLAWGAGILALAGGIVAAGLLWPSVKEPEPVYEGGRLRVYQEPKTVELTRESRAMALATAANFVKTAVVRDHVERSWELVSARLKEGYTQDEWSKGEIPVVPYPVAEAKWKLDYSYADAVGLQVFLYPRAQTGMRPTLFTMELTPVGALEHRRWVVDSWAPSGVASPALAPVASGGGGGVVGQPLNPAVLGGESRLGAIWLLAPIGIFAIVPLILVVFAARSWRRSRRAERAYREHAERKAGLGAP